MKASIYQLFTSVDPAILLEIDYESSYKIYVNKIEQEIAEMEDQTVD